MQEQFKGQFRPPSQILPLTRAGPPHDTQSSELSQ